MNLYGGNTSEGNEKVNWGYWLSVFGVKSRDDLVKICCPKCGKTMKTVINPVALDMSPIGEIADQVGKEVLSMFYCPECGRTEGAAKITIHRDMRA